VVARDGIEPPTPAFSGPRSTTELPGLSADFALQFPARIPALPELVGESKDSWLQQLVSVYQLAGSRARERGCPSRRLATIADATARAYQAARHQGPPALRTFLDQFPKGADLHVHLFGAVYAETFIRDAGEDGLCVDPAALSFAKPPCTPPLLKVAQLPTNQKLYDRLVNALSMRNLSKEDTR
jgi:hypothetical protein